jgi:hypothetical protein
MDPDPDQDFDDQQLKKFTAETRINNFLVKIAIYFLPSWIQPTKINADPDPKQVNQVNESGWGGGGILG